jgi:O-antigen biosynthesis protein WbqV
VTRRPSNRILLNLALDGLLALLALVLAVWAIAPRHWPSGAWWAVAAPGAVLALLAAGAVLRLPQQYWRFVGLRDLLAVAGAAGKRSKGRLRSVNGYGRSCPDPRTTYL